MDDQEWKMIGQSPKFQRLFRNAVEASKYRLVAEVIDSKGCHSGHVIGQKLIFDNSKLLKLEREVFLSGTLKTFPCVSCWSQRRGHLHHVRCEMRIQATNYGE